MVYKRGLVIGATLGLLLGALLASLLGGPRFHGRGLVDPGSIASADYYGALFGAAWGLVGGIAFGLGIAAVIVNLGTSEGRTQALEAPEPIVFPGMFGNPMGNPFDAMKHRIDAEEPAREGEASEAKAPATMPEKCPSCGEKLDAPAAGEEPSAFCYHCGGALA